MSNPNLFPGMFISNEFKSQNPLKSWEKFYFDTDIFFPWFLFVESTGTGDKVANYFGQLAAANHVKKLVERYLTLAPVFIGGPGKYLYF